MTTFHTELKRIASSLAFIALFLNQAFSQNIEFSTLTGPNTSIRISHVEDGYTYVAGTVVNPSAIPVTDNSLYLPPDENIPQYIAKLDPSGDYEYFTLLDTDFQFDDFIVSSGEVYLSGHILRSAFNPNDLNPVYTGMDIFVINLNSSGGVDYATTFGSSGDDEPAHTILESGNLYLTGSANLESFVAKVNASSGAVSYFNIFGGSVKSRGDKILKSGSYLYVAGPCDESNGYFDVSSGTQFYADGDFYLAQFTESTGAAGFKKRFGGNYEENIHFLGAVGSDLVLAGETNSSNFITTDGTAYHVNPDNLSVTDVFVLRVDDSGDVLYSSLQGTIDNDEYTRGALDGDLFYLAAHNSDPWSFTQPVHASISKFNTLATDETSNFNLLLGDALDIFTDFFVVKDGFVYASGWLWDGSMLTTDGSVAGSGNNTFLAKIDADNGDIAFAKIILHTDEYPIDMKITDCAIHMLDILQESFELEDFENDVIYYQFDLDGKLKAFKHFDYPLPDAFTENYPYTTEYLFIEDEAAIFTISSYATYSLVSSSIPYFPVTKTRDITYGAINFTGTVVKLDLCPGDYENTGLSDVLGNATQTICQNGFVQQLTGVEINIPEDEFPIIYVHLMPQNQQKIEAHYQWQVSSTSSSGPWTNIPGATQQNYTPTETSATRYYQRLAYSPFCCPTELISTSAPATIAVGSNVAPVADAGGMFRTCPSSAIEIGGSPAASGGTGPYTYLWTPSTGLSSNITDTPDASPSESTIYTLTVTDANGCKQVDQALVNVYQANAGPDLSSCDGDPRLINSSLFVGLEDGTDVDYSWSPGTYLSCTTCPQPIVTATGSQTYTLTAVLSRPGTTDCSTNDNVTITFVDGPTTSNFAGADVTGCFGGNLNLGTTAEGGFDYTWAPGSYLSTNSASETVYNSGTLSFPPAQDPATYFLTARSGNCSFVDEVVVSIIRADAGEDGCGPRLLGGNTDAPGLSETFAWTIEDGEGDFEDVTNIAHTRVGASTTGPVTYRLTTSLNGVDCYDEVIVDECSCDVDILVNSSFGCPNADLGTVTLSAVTSGLGGPLIYEWTPATGLSAYNTSTVTLTDNVPRTYTLTVRNAFEPTLSCTDEIDVNQANMTLPAFSAQDHYTCPGSAVSLGAAAVAGYAYSWSPDDGHISSTTSSNPTSDPTNSTNYTVRVTDTGTGCYIDDIAHIGVKDIRADAGADLYVCDNTVVTLGGMSQPGFTYSWTPVVTWQNGTSATSANPEVLVSTSGLSFTVSMTDGNCTVTDDINIYVITAGVGSLELADDASVCAGSSVQIGFPAISGATYSWSPSTGLSCTDCAQPFASPGSTQAYTVTATFAGSCSPATDNSTVTVHSLPSFSLSDIHFCPSETGINIGGDAPNDMAYYWEPDYNLSSFNVQDPVLTPVPVITTVYTLTVTDVNGCASTESINLIPDLSVPDAGLDQTICVGESVDIGTNSNPTGTGISYSWFPTSNLSSSTSRETTFTPVAAGTYAYTLTKTDSNLDCSSSEEVIITVHDVNIPDMDPVTICEGSSVAIGVPFQANINFSWNPSTALADPFVSLTTASPTSTTNYTLTATDLYGCFDSKPVKVWVHDTPAPAISLDDITVCLEEANTTLSPIITPSGTYTYQWSTAADEIENDGSITTPNSAGGGINLLGVGVQNYYLTVTNASTGCQSNADISIDVTDCPEPCSLIVNAPDFFCTESSFGIHASASPAGGTYSWSTGATGSYVGIDPGEGTDDIEIIVTYTNAASGCEEKDTILIPFNDNCCSAPELDCGSLIISSNFDECSNMPISTTLPFPAVLNLSSNCGIASFSNDYSGSLFPYGTTNVEWTVTNLEGDVSTCTQQVTLIYQSGSE